MELDRQAPVRRAHVIGTSGSGKTTLGARLAGIIAAPHIELDALHWRPNWAPLDRAVMRAWVYAMVQDECWVVDGNYSSVRDILWARADTLVWLDYSLARVMWRLWWRTLSRAMGRQSLWNENRESLWTHLATRDSLFLWALQTHSKHRRRYPGWLREPENAHLRLVHLRSPREADAWLTAVAAGKSSRYSN
ncbi:MAG: adenylate kinase [Anaerolineae bacterium]